MCLVGESAGFPDPWIFPVHPFRLHAFRQNATRLWNGIWQTAADGAIQTGMAWESGDRPQRLQYFSTRLDSQVSAGGWNEKWAKKKCRRSPRGAFEFLISSQYGVKCQKFDESEGSLTGLPFRHIPFLAASAVFKIE